MDGRATTTTRLVGRVPEQRRLAEVLAIGDGARSALVGGEAGIGKTRLVDEALLGAPADAMVLRLRGDALRRGRAYGALLHAVEPHVRTWTEAPRALSARARSLSRLLGPVAPALAPHDEAEGATSAASATSVEAAPSGELELVAIDLLRHLTPDPGPLVVVGDDLHWFDPESVGVLHALVAGVAGLDDAVVLGTYRPEGVVSRSPLAALVHLAERQPDAVNLRLGPLDLDEVAEVAGQVLGGDVAFRDVKALHQRSGGNPFFLEELLAAVGPDHEAGGLADLPLPWTIAELLRDQVQGLTDDERSLVETAAVLGQRVPFDLLARVSGVGERDLIDRLRGIVAAGLMVEDEIDVFEFRHALVCETLSAGLLGRERRSLHEAAVEALLAADDPDDAAVAHHARHAGRIDVMLDAVGRATLDELGRGSPHRALEFAEMGLSEAPDDVALLEVATRAAWLIGVLDDARAHGEAWVAAARSGGDRSSEARALRTLVRITWDRGDELSQARHLDDLVATLDSLEGVDLAESLAGLAQAHMLAGRSARVLEYADRAIEVAESCGDDRARAQALVERWSCAPAPDAADRLRDAIDDAERAGDHLTAARGLNNLLHLLPVTERRPVAERMRAQARRVGFTVLSSLSYADHLADLASIAADRSELERWISEFARSSRLSEQRKVSMWRSAFHLLLVTEESSPDDAEIDAVIAGVGGSLAPEIELVVLARRRDAEAAGRLLTGGLMGGKGGQFAVLAAAWIADTALRAGVAPDEVAAALHRIVDVEHRTGPIWAAAMALVAAARGDRSAAEAWVDAVTPEVHGWIRADLRTTLASLAESDGDTERALEHVDAAVAALARWPGWRRDRAEALRQRLERRTGDADDALTGREREVAALVAEGLTNAQIAERLFIARKTAAVHVSNILAKLGMRGRAEIAAWAVRQGLAATTEAS